MGVETSASHLIFFIGTVTVAVVVAGAMSLATSSFVNSLEQKGKRVGDELATDIRILNDPTNMVYNTSSHELTIYVKNTGSKTLQPSLIEVYVNGTYWAPDSTTLLGGASAWQQSKTVQVVITAHIPSGDHTLRVITQNGAFDSLNFRMD